MAESKSVVIAALVANGAIAVLKFVGYLLTGSPSMLSETYHSISDTGNQVFLLVGIRFSSKEANTQHPFGYGKAQFFYSFLVSVFLFGIAGWESLKHGYDAIVHPHPPGEGTATLPVLDVTFDAVLVNYGVLVGAIDGVATWLFEAHSAVSVAGLFSVPISAELPQLVMFLALVGVLVVRPLGLFGVAEVGGH